MTNNIIEKKKNTMVFVYFYLFNSKLNLKFNRVMHFASLTKICKYSTTKSYILDILYHLDLLIPRQYGTLNVHQTSYKKNNLLLLVVHIENKMG